ncbi:MAG: BatA domain-containing protein [Planctomycetes bacterium]|nr:BatA domain-containing protein [Planctomycetota bacterium]
MLEFAREQWLWLFLLLAVFYAAWLLARRYRKQRVTHAVLWDRVAARVIPPAWKRILRTVLTLLIATVMLASAVLYAAGLQRPPDELPGPLLLVIVQDNSVSMRAMHGESTRREMAHDRVRELLGAMGEHDRAVLAHFKHGQPLLGEWRAKGAEPGPMPPTDFTRQDMRALAAAVDTLTPPPGMPARPAPRKLVIWLGDERLDLQPKPAPQVSAFGNALDLGGTPLIYETFGGPADNDAIIAARYTPPAANDAHGGVVEAATLSGRDPIVRVGTEVELRGRRVELPPVTGANEVRISTDGGDALPDDDEVSFLAPRARIAGVAVCYPAEDGEANPFLLQALRSFLPGREFSTHPVPGTAEVSADLLIADRALPAKYTARAVLLFGVGGEAGDVGPPVRAEPNLRAPVDAADVGFEVPDLSLISAREARPLVRTGLSALTRHIDGGVLVGVQRTPNEILYCGFVPHESTLLQDRSGLLLILRWLEAVQRVEEPRIPPLVQAGEPVGVRAAGDVKMSLVVSPDAMDAAWGDAYRDPGSRLVRGPDGIVNWTVAREPGRWNLHAGLVEREPFTILWSDPHEQSLPYVHLAPIPLAAFGPPEADFDLRDWLPGLLLWLALGLLVIEWALWLVGVVE